MAKEPDTRDQQPTAEAAASRWERLPTEARHPASSDLDRMPDEEVVALLLDEDRRGLAAARGLSREIARAAGWLADSFAAGGTVLFAGAGTSGRLGVLEAAECPPTFGTDPARIRAAIAGGPEAVFEAREGAEDRAEEGRRAAEGLAAGDLLVGVSASSVTPFVRGSLAQATVRRRPNGSGHLRGCRGRRRVGRSGAGTRHRAGDPHRFDSPQGGLGDQGGAQRHDHGRDGPGGQGVREPDGRPAAGLGQARGPRPTHHPGRRRRDARAGRHPSPPGGPRSQDGDRHGAVRRRRRRGAASAGGRGGTCPPGDRRHSGRHQAISRTPRSADV